MSALPVADPWFTIGKVGPGIFRITEPHCDPLIRANCYLVKSVGRDMLVDTGMGIGRLRAELAPLLEERPIVFTTHAHVDHIGGHREFRDCEILVHPAEAEDLRRPPVPRGLGFDHFEPALRADLNAMGFRTEDLLIDALPCEGYDPGSYLCEGVIATRLVQQGAVVDLGDRRFEVLHLPGHSPGGLGLWEAATGVLFTGDTLYDGLLLDTITGASIPDLCRSLRRLRDLPATLILGGHRDPFGRARMMELIGIHLEYRGGAGV